MERNQWTRWVVRGGWSDAQQYRRLLQAAKTIEASPFLADKIQNGGRERHSAHRVAGLVAQQPGTSTHARLQLLEPLLDDDHAGHVAAASLTLA